MAAEDNSLGLQSVKSSDGLITHEPRISQTDLNDALIENKYLLNVQTNELKKFIAKNDISAQTNIMAAIMPGGLIYLAWKKTQLSNASDELETFENDLSALQADTIALRVTTETILVARFP